MKDNFKTANDAFEYFYDIFNNYEDMCEEFGDTRALFNVGFYIHQPTNNHITASYRKWNEEYAKAEWDWYLSADPSTDKLGELYGRVPPIWEKMSVGPNNFVNSNYGYQWERNYQLDKIVAMLKTDPESRRATVSIYDGKEIHRYKKDTPCTYAIQFTILNNRLNMSVYMRSNDIWYGFCNDQYCFSQLQKSVAERLSIETGVYYHHAHNLHLYNNQLNKYGPLQRRSNHYR